jgi:hypothetical protein
MTPRGKHFVDPDAGAFNAGAAPLGTGPQGRGGGGSSAPSLANELKEDEIMRSILAEALGGVRRPWTWSADAGRTALVNRTPEIPV